MCTGVHVRMSACVCLRLCVCVSKMIHLNMQKGGMI